VTSRSLNSVPGESVGSSVGAPEAKDVSAVIGHNLRSFRKELGLSLRALSERSGLSIGFLSQLERGLSSIGLTTLRDLAATLDREIVDFFDETDLDVNEPGEGDGAAARARAGSAVIRTSPASATTRNPLVDRYFTLTRASGEDTAEYISGKRTYRLLSQRASGLMLEPMLTSIAPGGVIGEMEAHKGEEFAYVLHGELSYTVDGVEYRLRAGDSLHLLSSIPHSLYNDTDETAVVVSVVTPRLF
jgi:quercetin dioxygenase-like cupin family protein/transcriptional regulator with XRE-family HTH domain